MSFYAEPETDDRRLSNVHIDLNIHSVCLQLAFISYLYIICHQITCPGVWLCQTSQVELSINTLCYQFRSKAIPARFPLFIHETFTMEGHYKDADKSIEQLIGRILVYTA